MPLDDVTYDFDKDEWVPHRLIQAHWIERELPLPDVHPAVGQWHARPLRKFDYSAVVNGIAAVALTSCCLLGYSVFDGLMMPALMSLLVLFGFVPASLFLVNRPKRLLATARDRSLIEDPLDLDVCLVEVAVYRHHQLVGVDRGVVWFDSGRLLFNGSRTSFAIGGEDVLPRQHWAGDSQYESFLALPLRVGGQGRVEFLPLRGTNLPSDHEERFVERLKAFRSRPPQSRGPRQWPPF